MNVLSLIREKFPGDSLVEAKIVEVLYLQGKYAAVLEAIREKQLDLNRVAPFYAGALLAQNRLDEGLEIFQKAAKNSGGMDVHLQYANLLMKHEKYEEATKEFQWLLKQHAESMAGNKALHAAVLNNLAWAYLQTETHSREKVMSVARKAHTLFPENPNFADTYARALLAGGEADKVVKLLKSFPGLEKERLLLAHLARAYEDQGDLNGAVRTYKKALAVQTGAGRLELKPSESVLKAKIEELAHQKTPRGIP